LRLFTLNISGPSVARADRLHDFLAALDADVLVLTETRATPGTEQLLCKFTDLGYDVVAPPPLTQGERGVAIIHRVPPTDVPTRRKVRLAHRALMCGLDFGIPVVLVGVYVPSRDASPEKIERKQAFLAELTRLLQAMTRQSDVIVMGDFNVVGRSHVPRYPAFRSWEYDALARIADSDLVDAFSELHPGVQAYSWIGKTGDGYRYDYVFLSRRLLPRVRRCEYLDEPRTLGLTDHAGMLMTIATSASNRIVGSSGPQIADALA
jgi:exodeoxyribonuclease III